MNPTTEQLSKLPQLIAYSLYLSRIKHSKLNQWSPQYIFFQIDNKCIPCVDILSLQITEESQGRNMKLRVLFM